MDKNSTSQPLADRLRPEKLADVIGQQHLIGEGKPLSRAVENNVVHSMIFWGPPGVGKTTLARIVASQTGRKFASLSAVSANKDDVRKVVEAAQKKPDLFSMGEAGEKGTVLFLDEIHRFNKAQQDFLLPYVEDGTITLIGATTENPSFEVISALLSRSQIFVLQALSPEEMVQVVNRGAAALGIIVEPDAAEFLANFANGDARRALNLLEAAHALYPVDTLTSAQLREALQSKHMRYDKAEEEHYNTVSAFIKSMRASQPDAALYYLARMVHGGEDPLFIARRMVIFASEDIGIAQPTALVVANEVFRACEVIGYPECQYNLAQGAVYLALAAKDRSSGEAYFAALEDVDKHGNLPIPMMLRNASTRFMKEIGYGQDYEQYSDKDYLPDALHGKRYFTRDEEA